MPRRIISRRGLRIIARSRSCPIAVECPTSTQIDANGANQTALTSGSTNYVPEWSPDGSKIVFISERDGGGANAREVYVMNANGTNQTRLTSNTAPEGFPAWSPDGTRIVFESARSGQNFLYVIRTMGADRRHCSHRVKVTTSPRSHPTGARSPGYRTETVISKCTWRMRMAAPRNVSPRITARIPNPGGRPMDRESSSPAIAAAHKTSIS